MACLFQQEILEEQKEGIYTTSCFSDLQMIHDTSGSCHIIYCQVSAASHNQCSCRL